MRGVWVVAALVVLAGCAASGGAARGRAGPSRWTYDANGLLAKAEPAGLPSTVYTYAEGLLTEAVFGTGTSAERTTYTYHPDGRVHRVVDPSGRTLTRTWGHRGLLASEGYGRDGDVIETSYTYDGGGFLESVESGGGRWEYQHGPLGELRSVSQPDVGAFTYGYDHLRQLTSVAPPDGTGVVLDYDYQGRVTRTSRGQVSGCPSRKPDSGSPRLRRSRYHGLGAGEGPARAGVRTFSEP